MKIYEKTAVFLLVLTVSLLCCSCGAAAPETDAQPEVSPAAAGDIKLMFYTHEIEGDISAVVGDSIELHAEVISASEDIPPVEWGSSCETSLSLEPGDNPNETTAKVLSTEKSPVMLTVSCGGIKKIYPVYIKPAQDGRESLEPGEIRLMYFNTELTEFTLRENETVQLRAELDGISQPDFEWTCSDENVLLIEHRNDGTQDAWITPGGGGFGKTTLTVSCGDIAKNFTVYIVG